MSEGTERAENLTGRATSIHKVAFGESDQPEGLIMTTLDSAINWARKSSVWPMTFGLDGHRRTCLAKDGFGDPSTLGADAGTQMGDLHGRMCDIRRSF